MNAYTLERHTNPPAFVVTLGADFNVETDAPKYYAELAALLNAEQEPITIIADMTQWSVQSFNDVLIGLKGVKDADTHPYRHPNTKKVVILTNSKVIHLSVNGARAFGIANELHSANTMQEALELA